MKEFTNLSDFFPSSFCQKKLLYVDEVPKAKPRPLLRRRRPVSPAEAQGAHHGLSSVVPEKVAAQLPAVGVWHWQSGDFLLWSRDKTAVSESDIEQSIDRDRRWLSCLDASSLRRSWSSADLLAVIYRSNSCAHFKDWLCEGRKVFQFVPTSIRYGDLKERGSFFINLFFPAGFFPCWIFASFYSVLHASSFTCTPNPFIIFLKSLSIGVQLFSW